MQLEGELQASVGLVPWAAFAKVCALHLRESTAMDWTREITEAQARITPYIQVTPTLTCQGFGLEHPIEMKLE